jgi:hypothetical protein
MAVSTAAPPVERFATIFREEHRVVRDLLVALVDAFEHRDPDRARVLLSRLAVVTGPHFRYEEESLYPALVPIFGADYVQKLLDDHDGAIAAARRLVELAGKTSLGVGDVAEGVRLVRSILPHVSDCEGLTIMVEILPDELVATMLEARERANADGLDLLTWASEVRSRPA